MFYCYFLLVVFMSCDDILAYCWKSVLGLRNLKGFDEKHGLFWNICKRDKMLKCLINISEETRKIYKCMYVCNFYCGHNLIYTIISSQIGRFFPIGIEFLYIRKYFILDSFILLYSFLRESEETRVHIICYEKIFYQCPSARCILIVPSHMFKILWNRATSEKWIIYR